MTRNTLTGFFPFRLVQVDADTGKPLDPNIGRRTEVSYYDIKKDKNGKRSIVAHRSPTPSAQGGNGKDGDDKPKKNDNGGKGKDGGNNGGKNKQEDEKKSGGGGGNDNSKPFTAEEDAELRAFKAEQKSWKDIAAEMKRSVQQLKEHWKEIEGKGDADKANEKNDNAAKKDNGGGGGEQKKMTKNEKKAAKQANKEADEKKPSDGRKEKEKSKPAAKAGSEARFTMNEWVTLQEDSLFSFGELQCLSELIMKDQNQTWLRIAAAFYDKTGRRVHPDDIREKFEEMARMG